MKWPCVFSWNNFFKGNIIYILIFIREYFVKITFSFFLSLQKVISLLKLREGAIFSYPLNILIVFKYFIWKSNIGNPNPNFGNPKPKFLLYKEGEGFIPKAWKFIVSLHFSRKGELPSL